MHSKVSLCLPPACFSGTLPWQGMLLPCLNSGTASIFVAPAPFAVRYAAEQTGLWVYIGGLSWLRFNFFPITIASNPATQLPILQQKLPISHTSFPRYFHFPQNFHKLHSQACKMMFTTATLMSAFSFLSLCLAIPMSNFARNDDPTACQKGKSFYNCQKNGFKGCCTIDPCALPSCPDPPILDTIGLNRICTPGQHKVYQPTMNTIFPAFPDASSKGSELWISQSTNPSNTRQQVVTFSGIPFTAQNCSLNWSSGSTSFNVSGSGLTDVSLVNGPPSAVINSKVISAAVGMKIGAADFTNWPQQKDASAYQHIVGSAPNCSAEMTFMVGIAVGNVGEVRLQLDQESGFYVEYEC